MNLINVTQNKQDVILQRIYLETEAKINEAEEEEIKVGPAPSGCQSLSQVGFAFLAAGASPAQVNTDGLSYLWISFISVD